MKNYCGQIMMICTWLIASSAIAGEKISQNISVSPDGKLFIDITRGLVKIEGWDKEQITIMGELDDAVKSLIVKNKGDKTLIKAVSKGEILWGDSSVLKVFMPRHTKLYFKGIDTTFTVTALNAGVQGKSISGDLLASQLSATIALSSMSGHIKVLDSSGEISLESVSGDIIMAGSYQQAELRSTSGNIKVNIEHIAELEAKTVSGELRANGGVQANADIKLISVSGDIIYQASKELNAKCDITSQFGGQITNLLTTDKAEATQMNGKRLSFISGEGLGDILLHSISGNVTIEQGIAQ